jgi:hypothetical protein
MNPSKSSLPPNNLSSLEKAIYFADPTLSQISRERPTQTNQPIFF